MRRRGIDRQRPGAYDYAGESWREEEAFDALRCDCFKWLFIMSIFSSRLTDRSARLRHLRDIARAESALVKIIVHLVHQFVNELEKKKDPAGHAAYMLVQKAVAEMVGPDPTAPARTSAKCIANPAVIFPARATGKTVLTPAELREFVNSLADRTFTQRMSSGAEPGLQAARELIRQLLTDRAAGWRVGDLVDAIKSTQPHITRSNEEGDGPCRSDPPSGLETVESLTDRYNRTKAGILNLGSGKKVTQRLGQVWDWMFQCYLTTGAWPKAPDVGKQFQRSRQRVNEDLKRLRPLIEIIWGTDPDG
jgi:hypothetical protein